MRLVATPACWIAPILWLIAAGLPPGPAAAPRSPNELGSIMILEYHRIGEPEGRWTRSPASLRGDLERLWRHAYRAVPLNDLVSGVIDLPVGMSPVVLTFDDSSPGQFRYLERDGHLLIDPDCAVGILGAFARLHPEFSARATFFVLPAAAEPHRLFGQPEHEARKIRYLVSHGFEVGNHTLWHADLSKYPEAVVRAQLALAQQRIEQIVPGYRLRTLALPMGNYPRELEWAIRGHADRVTYEHEAILLRAGRRSRTAGAGGGHSWDLRHGNAHPRGRSRDCSRLRPRFSGPPRSPGLPGAALGAGVGDGRSALPGSGLVSCGFGGHVGNARRGLAGRLVEYAVRGRAPAGMPDSGAPRSARIGRAGGLWR